MKSLLPLIVQRFLLLLRFIYFCLKFRITERARESDCFSFCWFTSQGTGKVTTELIRSWESEVSSRLPMWVEGVPFGPSSAVFPIIQQQTGSEVVEKLGHKLVCVWNVSPLAEHFLTASSCQFLLQCFNFGYKCLFNKFCVICKCNYEDLMILLSCLPFLLNVS